MKNVLAILPLIMTSSLAFATTSVVYQGDFTSKATSYKGNSYNKTFQASVAYSPNLSAHGTATVHEDRYCKNMDDSSVDCTSEEDFETYCVTSLDLDLGRVDYTITDVETGEVVRSRAAWKAQAGSSYKKTTDEACVATSLNGQLVKAQTSGGGYLTPATANTKRLVGLVADAVDNRGQTPAIAAKLVQVGNDKYKVVFSEAKKEVEMQWDYLHEISNHLTWGNSGTSVFKKIVK